MIQKWGELDKGVKEKLFEGSLEAGRFFFEEIKKIPTDYNFCLSLAIARGIVIAGEALLGICYDVFDDHPECEGEGLALATTFPEGQTMVEISLGTTSTQSTSQSNSQSTSQIGQATTEIPDYGSKPL